MTMRNMALCQRWLNLKSFFYNGCLSQNYCIKSCLTKSPVFGRTIGAFNAAINTRNLSKSTLVQLPTSKRFVSTGQFQRHNHNHHNNKNNNNYNKKGSRSASHTSTGCLAAAAACVAHHVDEGSYWSVTAHEIESTIEDLKNLLSLIKTDNANGDSFNGWNAVWESPSITIWSRPLKGFTQYKVHGHYDDIPAVAFFFIQMDLAYRKSWDSNTDDVQVFATEGENSDTELVYWRVHFPRPMAKRDYVYARRYLVDLERNLLVLINKAVEHPDKPESRQCVRVTDYSSKMVLQPYSSYEQDGFDYVMKYYDDNKLKMPSYAYKQLVKTNLPRFLDTVHKEAKSLMDEYNQIIESGGDFKNASHRIQAFHQLVLNSQNSQKAKKSSLADSNRSMPIDSVESLETHQASVDMNEIEEERVEISKLSRFRRLPVKKITPPQYLPDIKQFARTLITEKKITPLQFKQVHSEANRKRVQQHCRCYPTYTNSPKDYPKYSDVKR